jgi:hypothetical protein
LAVIEFCRHGKSEAQSDRAEDYARALDIDLRLINVSLSK